LLLLLAWRAFSPAFQADFPPLFSVFFSKFGSDNFFPLLVFNPFFNVFTQIAQTLTLIVPPLYFYDSLVPFSRKD